MLQRSTRDAIVDLLYTCARSIDQDKLEEWPEWFTEDGVYRVIPRENLEQNLPLAVLFFEGRDMLRDRVTSLRQANIYNKHYSRHLITNILIEEGTDGRHRAHSNYTYYTTDLEGTTSLFSVGAYDDEIVFVGGQARLKQRTVILDTFGIANLLAVPI